jgi:hypothetical protein
VVKEERVAQLGAWRMGEGEIRKEGSGRVVGKVAMFTW